MAGERLNLCKTFKPQTRDGHTGPNAHMLLPFHPTSHGIWFADGRVMTNNTATIGQYQGTYLGAKTKPDTFKKDCCHCA